MTNIRRSRSADGDRAIDIWRSAVDATHHFLTPEDRLAIDREVQGFLPQMPLWLAVDDRDVAMAFMGLTGSVMEALWVHADHRGKGIGRSLVEHALGLTPILTTDVNEQNELALGFYERLGFVRSGRSPDDGAGRPYPLIHLRFAGPLGIKARHDLSPADIDMIEDRLYDYNRRATGCDDARELAFTISDEDGRIVGVAAGYSWAGSAELKQLWVDDDHRGRGHGQRLLDAFVDETRQRGVRSVWVASYSFQAPKFYERAGFVRVAELDGWPYGHANIVLRKTFCEDGD